MYKPVNVTELYDTAIRTKITVSCDLSGRHLEIYLGKANVSHSYFFFEDYKAIAKFSKIVIFLLCDTMTTFINRHNLVFVIFHGNGTMNTLLILGGEIIGENVKFNLLQLRPVHTWTRVTLVRAIQSQSARAQKDLEGLIAEIVSIQ